MGRMKDYLHTHHTLLIWVFKSGFLLFDGFSVGISVGVSVGIGGCQPGRSEERNALERCKSEKWSGYRQGLM